MNGQKLLLSMGYIDEKYVNEAEYEGTDRKIYYLRHGIKVAVCFAVILSGYLVFLLRLTNKNVCVQDADLNESVVYHPNENIESEIYNSSDKIQINMSDILVNELTGVVESDQAILNSDLNHEVIWDSEKIVSYYGKDLTPSYIPQGYQASLNNEKQRVFVGNDNIPVEDTVCLQFYTDYYEDGSPKPIDNQSFCDGFAIKVSKLGIWDDCIYWESNNQIEISNIAGIDAQVGHISVPYGPYDDETHEPSGYFDRYIIIFSEGGIDYQIVSDHMVLEEVIKVATSVIVGEQNIEFIN